MSTSSLFENLKKFIQVIDKLKDIGLDKHITLPKIIVVGSQSSGKSSLLESIVGLDFLPRGSGVVTRRPLELRLVSVQEPTKPYGIFDKTEEKIYDFDKIRDEIIRQTDIVAGKNQGIVDNPIILKVFSNVTPDLTLVDLPGITRIAMHKSDQSDNIEQITMNMARRYIKDERSIILCVIPANADISTSDGLKLARDIDPNGNRTIGVLTKVDIMDKGTDCRSILLNQQIPLKLGYIAVKNRTQLDINNNLKVQEALLEEKSYFASNQLYSSLPEGFTGTTNLTKKLSELLYKQIKYHLPDIFQEIENKIREASQKLSELGYSLPTNSHEKFQLLFSMVSKFADELSNSIKGKFTYNNKNPNSTDKKFPEGAKLRILFNDLYKIYCKPNYNAADRYQDKDIQRAIKLHEGDSLSGFQSIDAFFYLLHPILEELKDPAHDLINSIYSQLELISNKILNHICQRLPYVQTELQDLVNKYFERLREHVRNVVDDYLSAQINYIYTTDNESLNSYNEMLQAAQQANNQDPNELLIKEMRSKIDIYSKVIIKELRDTIPKMIGCFFIQKIENEISMVLIKDINDNSEVINNIQENPLIVTQRQKLQIEIDVLNDAKKFIKKDPKLMDFIQERQKIMMEQQEQDRQQKKQQLLIQQQEQLKQQQIQQKQESQDQSQNNQYCESPNNKSINKLNSENAINQSSDQKYNNRQQINQTASQNQIQEVNINIQIQNNQIIQNNNQINQKQQSQQKTNQFNPFDNDNPNFKQSQQNPQQQQQQQYPQQYSQQLNPQLQKQQQQQIQQPQQNLNIIQNQQRIQQQNQQQNQQQQQQTQPKQQQQQGFVDNMVDKGVDKLFNNQQFQKQMNEAAQKAVYNTVNSQIPIKDKEGNNPLGNLAAKGADKLLSNQNVQNAIKDQAKTQIKQEVKKESKGFFW